MAPALALQHENAGKRETSVEDPFASPVSVASSPLTLPKPEPCAQPPYSPRYMPHAAPDTEAYDEKSRQLSTSHTYKSASWSSGGDSDFMMPVAELETSSLAKPKEPKRSSKRSHHSNDSRGSKDPEKALYHTRKDSARSNNPHTSTSITYSDDEEEEDHGRREQEQKAVKILLFMSAPCVLLSTLNALWALIAIFITALSQPIRLCAKRPTFGQQLAGLLGPTLNLQLRCIYTPLPPHANEDGSYHAFTLFLVHMLSPFLSFAVMFAAWTLAIYWVSSAVVGDPAGQDRRDDGKETVLGLRNWWERWLVRSVVEEER